MTGWISLHRSIEDHWMYEEERVFSKFEAWISLLLMVNHKDGKTTIGNQVIEVKRGQRITSIKKLSEKWSWSRTKVKAFLTMLQDDDMIDMKTTSKYTLITVVKYDFYQSQDGRKNIQKDMKKTSDEHELDMKKTSVRHEKDTNNNDNNELIITNNEKKEDKREPLGYEERVGRIFKAYEYFGFGMITPAANDQINNWLEKHNPEVIIEALREAYNEGSKKHNYVNKILTRWEADGLDTVEKVKADKRRFELSNMQPKSYQQKRRETPGEVAPGWMKEEKDKPKEKKPSEPPKTAADDPEVRKMIDEFRGKK